MYKCKIFASKHEKWNVFDYLQKRKRLFTTKDDQAMMTKAL